MCGFLFIMQSDTSSTCWEDHPSWFASMQHRGPDHTFSRYPKPNVFMGQHILNIVGHVDEEHYRYKNLHLVYNGEIYNYDTSFENDTHFLAHYLYHNWNDVDFGKLDGMYAFVAYKDGDVLIGRDPFGQIPLYTFQKNNLLMAASEVHAIKNDSPLNFNAIKNYFFTRHYIDNENSIYKNCYQVPPGHLKQYNSCVLVKDEAYSPKEFIGEPLNLSENEYLEELDTLLKRSIKQMIPNRKFTSIISGGIDSSLVSWYVSRESNDANFVGLNNIGKDRVSCDIEKFEPFLGKEIKRVDITKEEWLEAFYHAIANVMKDLPRSWSTISYYLVSNAIKPSKVLFTGEAADELFGGYKDYLNPGTTKYSEYSRRDIFEKMPIEFKPEISTNSFLTDVMNNVPAGCYAANTGAAINGVETRNPFLRFDIVRFALNIPTEYKIRNGTTKYLLKKLFEKKFSKELVYNKQGFSAFPEDTYDVPKYMEEFKELIGFKNDPKGDDKWKLACGAVLHETI